MVAPAARLASTSRYPYLHFGKGLERVCLRTGTFFGPGFLSTRMGRHFTFTAIFITSFLGYCPACSNAREEGDWREVRRRAPK